MNAFWQRVWIIFFGKTPKPCPELDDHESCHKHRTVPPGMKGIVGIFAPLFAIVWTILWTLWFSGFWKYVDEALQRSNMGLYIIGVVVLLLWFLSIIWTTHSRLTTVKEYLGAGLAAPFTLLALIAPPLFAAAL